MRELWYCKDCKAIDNVVTTVMTDPYGTGDSPTELDITCGECGSYCVDLEWLCECEESLPFEDWEDCAECIATGKVSHLSDYEEEDIELAKAELARIKQAEGQEP